MLRWCRAGSAWRAGSKNRPKPKALPRGRDGSGSTAANSNPHPAPRLPPRRQTDRLRRSPPDVVLSVVRLRYGAGASLMYESIVVGTDGSESAQRAVTQATALAKAVAAKVHLVSAFEPLRGVRIAGAPGAAQMW